MNARTDSIGASRPRTHLVQPWPAAGTIGTEERDLVRSGDGIHIVDDKGRKLIDGPAGMWCTNVGHRRSELADAMRDQALSLSFNSPWYTENPPAKELARRLAAEAPGDLEHVFLTSGGSTANETALRFVHYRNNVTGRPNKKRILCRQDGYHGSTYLAASLNGDLPGRDWMDRAGDLTIRLSSPNRLLAPPGMGEATFRDRLLEEAEAAISEHSADSIAAFVGEPVMASGGVIVPPEGYFRGMRELCARHDILFISDEVVTGFGRLGHVFASKPAFDVEPDIITFAKGVTSGYFPLGGMVASARLMDELRDAGHPDALFAHGLTYSGHPIGCAVALKNLDILEGDLLDHARELIPHFQEELGKLAGLPLVRETRGTGLMACVECSVTPGGSGPSESDTEIGGRIDRHCQELGLLLRPIRNMCVLSPPLCITREQVTEMFGMLKAGIELAAEDLRKEGAAVA